MRLYLCLLTVSCACALDEEGRARKQPIVVDAVGNTLPPPSNLPATVGSPVNLLTPDRYEFYTFDESGELVKKLMTLEEIQAIVAAGEEAEGLVTLASDSQPTMPFNITQPSYNKVHSVLTNVQNVLKAQMEAHKNNPMLQPTLDTPDVSDSWSLILPSIFGNTGLDIVPDKIPANITPPETDTLEFKPDIETDVSLSKEGSNDIISSSTIKQNDESLKYVPTTVYTPYVDEVKTTPTTSTTFTITTTTTTPTPSTSIRVPPSPSTTRAPLTTTTTKGLPSTITTTVPPSTIISRTSPASTTIKAPPSIATTKAPSSTTTRVPPSTISASTTTKTTSTSKPATKVTSTNKPFTIKTKTTTVQEPYQKITTFDDFFTKATTTAKPSTKFALVKTTSITTKQVTTLTTPSTTTRKRPFSTTSRPTETTAVKLHTTSTSQKPTTIKSTPKVTSRPLATKKQPPTVVTTPSVVESHNNEIKFSSTEQSNVNSEKNSNFIPISTVTYITERTTQKQQPSKIATLLSSTTQKIITTTESPKPVTQKIKPDITTYKPPSSTVNNLLFTAEKVDREKTNMTTLTTQSVSPSTTVSSTAFLSTTNSHESNPIEQSLINDNKETALPLFDVAQSISQIASDLGGNYMPIPTVSNMIDTTKLSGMDLESKENVEIDILPDNDTNTKKSNVSESNTDNFVKISTLDPHDQTTDTLENNKETTKVATDIQSNTSEINTVTLPSIESTTIDKILSESMGDLLSQIVNQAPQSIMEPETDLSTDNKVATTEKHFESTITENSSSLTTVNINSSTENIVSEKEYLANDIPIIENRFSEKSTPAVIETTIVPLKVYSKFDSTEKPLSKEDNKNYVQISVSNEKSTTLASITDKINTENSSTVSSVIENVQNIEQESVPKAETQVFITLNSSTNPSKTEEDTTKDTTVEPINPVKKNENTVTNINANNNIKINTSPKLPTEDKPKIEEFKKKFQKVNIDDKELANERNNSWKLIPTVSPPKTNEVVKDKIKNTGVNGDINPNKDIVLDFSKENQGLEVTTKDLEEDMSKFTELCNELAFRYWNTITDTIDKRRSFVLSPYSITSMLAMMFMGARGATSGEMNDILKLDDMVTFNPHFTLKNISDSIETTHESGVVVSAFIRELYSDKTKGKILTFYKERAQQFYNGHVEEINFKLVSDIIRRRTNLLVKRYTWGKIAEYMKSNTITMNPPLAAFSANIFQTDCTGSSVEGRDGEMYFVVSPNVRQRRLVPVPAVVYRNGFLAGYDPVLDATAAALGNTNSIISTLFVMPGQQGNVVHAEDLEALEQRLLDANPTTPAWNRLLRTLLPRIGLELQIPRFSHKSIFNISSTLRSMGLKDLFDAEHADLGGLNGPSKDIYLSDMIQSTSFVTCGEGVIGEQHHMEEYPEALGSASRRRSARWVSDWEEPMDYQRAFHDPHDVGEAMHLPLHLRPRQARLPARNTQPARLKFDRPFLYFVRHNPTGMILYVGRYNPRLLP